MMMDTLEMNNTGLQEMIEKVLRDGMNATLENEGDENFRRFLFREMDGGEYQRRFVLARMAAGLDYNDAKLEYYWMTHVPEYCAFCGKPCLGITIHPLFSDPKLVFCSNECDLEYDKERARERQQEEECKKEYANRFVHARIAAGLSVNDALVEYNTMTNEKWREINKVMRYSHTFDPINGW